MKRIDMVDIVYSKAYTRPLEVKIFRATEDIVINVDGYHEIELNAGKYLVNDHGKIGVYSESDYRREFMTEFASASLHAKREVPSLAEVLGPEKLAILKSWLD